MDRRWRIAISKCPGLTTAARSIRPVYPRGSRPRWAVHRHRDPRCLPGSVVPLIDLDSARLAPERQRCRPGNVSSWPSIVVRRAMLDVSRPPISSETRDVRIQSASDASVVPCTHVVLHIVQRHGLDVVPSFQDLLCHLCPGMELVDSRLSAGEGRDIVGRVFFGPFLPLAPLPLLVEDF